MAILVLVAAIASVWLTDVTGWFRLNRVVAGVVAVVASLVAFHEAFPLDSVVSILAIAQLLVYLQIILLFQHKETRTYWLLIVLSLLQVVVAAVFNQGAAFGLLMVVYLFVALATMTLLLLHREAQHLPRRAGAGAPRRRRPAGDGRWPPSRRSSPATPERNVCSGRRSAAICLAGWPRWGWARSR